MKLRDNFVIFLLFNARVIKSDLRFVNYTIVPPVSSSPGRRTCAEAYADNEYMAARVNDVTGICEGLTWDWGSYPQFETGYSYFRKTKTVEIYQPSVNISAPLNWLIPGTFGVGGRLEFYISMPTGTAWTGFEINILDKAESSYSLYDNEPEIIMVHILVSIQQYMLAFKTWADRWSNKLLMQNPFALGSIHRITVVPHTDGMQRLDICVHNTPRKTFEEVKEIGQKQKGNEKILLDGEEVVQYNHPTDPATAKQIEFSPYSNTVFELHNITFIGI